MQKAFEALSEEDLPQLLMEFHQSVLTCIHDQNGNHVIQKCIEVLSTKAKQALAAKDWARAEFFGEQIDFVIDDVLNNVVSLSCHPYGCRVLQRILEHCVEGKKNRALDVIAECHKVLLDDQYGNYVIQHVLQYGRNSDRQSVLGIVVANGLLTLSKQKFASNVVEKLLKYGTPSQRNALVREMLKVRSPDALDCVFISPFSNFGCAARQRFKRIRRYKFECRSSYGSRCLRQLCGSNYPGCGCRGGRKEIAN